VLRDSAAPPPFWETTTRTIAQGRSQADVAAGTPDIRRETLHATVAERYQQIVQPDTTPWAPENLVDYYRRFA
jgi:hypothetical protein